MFDAYVTRGESGGRLRPAATVGAGALILAMSACGGSLPRAPAEDAASGQQREGRALYGDHCRGCHDGAGGSGEVLSPRLLASHFDAGSLYAYIELAMPYDDPGSLGPAAYWAITAYLISDRGLARLTEPLAEGSASAIRLLVRPDG